MKIHPMILAGIVVLTLLAARADAQILPRWFGPKAADKNAPAKLAQPDSRRATEVGVEVAWLADPVTFPYYLEAHATNSQLEVRGYVPNKAVREQALRIAQVYSSLPVADAMKEHPSLLIRPSQMSPQQLQSSVTSSLRVALPKQYQQLKAECGSDGKVYVVGTVNTFEEKLAVSHSLRRLHGCTSVQNLTMLPNELAQDAPREKTPIVKTSNQTQKPVVALEAKSKSWWPFSRAQTTTTEEPPLLDPRKLDLKAPPTVAVKKPLPAELKAPEIVEAKRPLPTEGPILIPSSPEPKREVIKVESPSKEALTGTELQKRIQTACPQVKSVEVEFLTAPEVRITLELATENDLKSTAERVFALPELQNYRPELQFKISAP